MTPEDNLQPHTDGEKNVTGHALVLTGDGSYTLFLPEYNEHMHSLSGAYEEALLKHIQPSGILAKKTEHLMVLDVGFGLGYNILALIVSLNEKKFPGRLSVISLEKDRTLLPDLRRITFADGRNEVYSFIRDAYMNGTGTRGPFSIDVKFGDARTAVRSLPDAAFDAVFFDPFSPSRNPELWSVDFFREMSRLMNDASILTTYSSAPQIRGALFEAGFIVGRGPSVGGKREGTLAAKTAVIPPLSAEERDILNRNVHSTPYRDEQLSGDPTSVLERRKGEMGILRDRKKKTGV